MKFVLILLTCVIVLVWTEHCDHDSDCVLTQCLPDFKPDCYEHKGTHICTCVPHDNHVVAHFNCTDSEECWSLFEPCTGAPKWHCLDHKCKCADI